MKKSVAFLAGAAGMAILAGGVSLQKKKSASKKKRKPKRALTVVDSADGPTAIFLAGRLGCRTPFDKWLFDIRTKKRKVSAVSGKPKRRRRLHKRVVIREMK